MKTKSECLVDNGFSLKNIELYQQRKLALAMDQYAEIYFADKAKEAGFLGRTCSRQLTKIKELQQMISDLNAHISRLGAENEGLMKISARIKHG